MFLTMTVGDEKISGEGKDTFGEFDINGDINGKEFDFVK